MQTWRRRNACNAAGQRMNKADSFAPTQEMARVAQRGLDLREEHGVGGTDIGVTRANQLVRGENLTLDTVNRMVSFFARHEENAKGSAEDGDAGAIAWMLWGGDPGRAWAERIVEQQEAEKMNKVAGTIIRKDEDQRIVWGWASVVTEKGEPVIDSQGDLIEPAEMEKAANEFMADARMAKAMHQGEGVGEVIHSLPLTKELGEALGIQSDREGWILAMKIHDDAVWQRIKSQELRAFSIGGEATTEPFNA